MLFFRKNIIIIILVFVATASMHAQSFIPTAPYVPITGSVKETKQTSGKGYTIMPFVCYDSFLFANTGGFGCDFKYLRPSGFALYGNAGLLFGKYKAYDWDDRSYRSAFTFLFSLEGLLGYSKTFAKKHTMAFGIGLQGAYGVGMVEFIAVAFRFEYLYLITNKYGVHFSFTDGLGVGKGFINRASLRAGPVIYF